jgi:hypothetical protein
MCLADDQNNVEPISYRKGPHTIFWLDFALPIKRKMCMLLTSPCHRPSAADFKFFKKSELQNFVVRTGRKLWMA